MVFRAEVVEAMKRWRWRRVEQAFPELAIGSNGRGGEMRPVWAALNSREVARVGTQAQSSI